MNCLTGCCRWLWCPTSEIERDAELGGNGTMQVEATSSGSDDGGTPRLPPPPPVYNAAATRRPSVLLSSAAPSMDAHPEDRAIIREFNTRISHNIPPKDPAQDTQVALRLKDRAVPLDMHRISLHDNHYLATSNMWMQSDPYRFWTVVGQTRPALIVKLTPDVATSWRQLYWPKRVGATFQGPDPAGPIVTYISEEQINRDLVKRVMEVAFGTDAFRVTLLDYLSWQDFGVPDRDSFTAFLDVVDRECPETSPDKRILVHCGAGIGRTGTFIAAHASRRLPAEQKTADLFFNLVMGMRQQRQKPMVETSEQYLFLHKLKG